MPCTCECHGTICVVCSCLHEACGSWCAVGRRIRSIIRRLARRIFGDEDR